MPSTEHELLETLRTAQRLGFFGERSIEEAVEHARSFCRALGPLGETDSIVDIGSGGGLPGLVIAVDHPHVPLTLIDRREKRTDFLSRAVRRLGLPNVEVISADVTTLTRQVSSGAREPFSVVTARGFGPPEETLTLAAELVDSHGRLVISEPPSGNRWDEDLLDRLGLVRTAAPHVAIFTRRTS